ncbi:LLM class flavin-dependent oxidoreductase [Pseudalkalibacillus caeni]|uniref:LLM class flavin-dependent oxidoreductase n=1 Tax=Exobacillus caeni TaxID=2574798 RepID=A0A5R9EVE9_9BACL|nr:LLM class flavin-dependent oxidoreductase [Pseudalkalibacillus caeni]TLS35027.1 LLM class flavin-dependent oxidoreductase [Pseudalkalibacillus caeni]
MKLSILDLSPISTGKTSREALQESMELARIGENLGYTRYWVTEHHDLEGLASSAPEILLAYIGANTNRIRIGSGAVLLPHYKPYKIAETFNMLATLFPGRIDLGVGRAPGGSAEVTMALSDNFLEQVRKMPESLSDLLNFLYQTFPEDNKFSKVSAAPVPDVMPVPWLLGTSIKSARLAAEYGIPYAFGQFMSDKEGASIIKEYKDAFMGGKQRLNPETIITVSVICAKTTEEAEELALSSDLWSVLRAKGEAAKGIPSIKEAKEYVFSEEEQEKVKKGREKVIIGNPTEVKEKLQKIQEHSQADEIMITTVTHRFEDRAASYDLIAKSFLK